MPAGGGTEDTDTTADTEPSERSAASRSARAPDRHLAEVGLGHHQHVGDLHDPGLQELQDVAGCRAAPRPPRCRPRRRPRSRIGRRRPSRSPPRRTRTASAVAAARVAGARPPRRSPAAVERMNTAVVARDRARSARGRRAATPPERREVGSTASTATERADAASPRTSRDSSEDLPTPGGPVTPTMCPGASPPSAAGETAASSASACARASGRAALDQVEHGRGGAGRSRFAQARPELAAVGSAPGLKRRGGVDAVALGDQRDDVAHHPVEIPVLGGVDRGHAGLAQRRRVGLGDDAADHHRHVLDAGLGERLEHGRDQLGCEPDRIERPITCTPSWAAELAICDGVRRMPS